jgi:hypothetical protein
MIGIVDCVGGARLDGAWRILDAEDEAQAREHRLQRRPHAAFEPTALGAFRVKAHQCIHVPGGHRAAIRLRRQPFDDASGARHGLLRRGRAAGEDRPARGIVGYAGDLERPDDGEVPEVRQGGDAVANADLRIGV